MFVLGFGVKKGLGEFSSTASTLNPKPYTLNPKPQGFKSDRLYDGCGRSEGLGGWGLGVQ